MDRLSVTDHVTGLFQTERNPMNIGGLLLFDVPADQRSEFAERIAAHLAMRLPATPLARRLVRSPQGYDAHAWFQVGAERALAGVRRQDAATTYTPDSLRERVKARSMERIDTTVLPYELDIYDRVEGPHCALFLKLHHTCMDGIGYQQLVALLSDQGGTLPLADSARDEQVPSEADWLTMAEQRFAQEAAASQAKLVEMGAAQQALERLLGNPAFQRGEAPAMAFGNELTTQRGYRTLALPLEPLKEAGRRLGATVNDMFLAVAAGALRSYLGARGQLPDAPLISHSVRSTRRAEHGMTGNRVASIYPELATDAPDRMVRLERIKAAMAHEKQRSALEEPLLDPPDSPFGTRDREAAFADPAVLHAALGSANVVLSNVPGPEQLLSYAGFTLAGNYPVPIVGPARFLNITTRRNGPALNLGVMVDAAKITGIDAFIDALQAEFEGFVGV